MAKAKKEETPKSVLVEQKAGGSVKRLPWYKRLWEWFIGLFVNEYELIIWFHNETDISQEGLKTVRRTRREFLLKSISKSNSKHIKGTDAFGKPFEIKTVEPFDYQIRKLR